MNYPKQDIDQFISQLTLVKYSTGALGTFFLNLLMADSSVYDRLKITNEFGRDLNAEWRSMTYNDDIYSDDQYKVHWSNLCKQKPKVQDFLFARHLVFNQYINIIMKKDIRELLYPTTKFPDFRKKITVDDIPADIKVDVLLPYIKCHDDINLISDYIDELNLKQKIYCFFPTFKKWVQHVLTLHKHVIADKIHSPASIEFIDCLLNKTSYDIYLKNWTTNLDLSDYVKVNMYDLILDPTKFNSSLDYLKNNIKDFELTPKKLTMINTVKQDTLFILKNYGFDPNMDFDLDNDFESFIKACSTLISGINKVYRK